MLPLKKFSFSLDNVLNYKQQVLDNLKNEHAAILAQIREQEKRIEEIQEQYDNCNACLKEKVGQGIIVQMIFTYENYMEVLAYKKKKEKEVLMLLKQQEEVKRQQLIEAKTESASIEKLKENKISIYKKELQKEQELLIEEFVANARAAGN